MDMRVAKSERTERLGEICKFWLQGRCNRNPCSFWHGETPPPPQSAGYRHTKTSSESVPYYNSKAVLISKSRVGSGIAEPVQKPLLSRCNARTPSENNPKHNSKAVLNTKSGQGTCIPEASQKPSLSICKYWVTGNCTYGDQCRNLHSWHNGDGISTLAKLHEHKKTVTGIAFPAGSDKLYSGSTDGTVRTWDCHTGQCANVTNLGAEVASLICEGPWIFVGLLNAVKAWHIPTASEFTLLGPKGRVLAMIVGNDTLFAAAEDGVISAWRGSSDANSPFELVASLSGHTKAVSCLTVGVNRLYSGSMDQSIKVWDLDTLECLMTLNGHTGEVTSLICWSDFLLSGASDCTIKIWVATEEGPLKVTYTHTLENGVVALNGMTDAEGKHVLCCSSRDNSVRLYELPPFSERGRLFARKEIRSIEVGPGGLFFTGDGTGLVMVWKWLEETKVAASS
ncbi:zinc finger CCCH domain-containing protein 48-like [Lotus japonicus]|uniref:zinc finger CCCH domain-containing protein 48-like n=1 Tax=Lotus japonicus TaxID=34305 RepID=UPI00258EF274|nr:zinc finger CCCH domain-containing protein 48-like [Lotus japonicus]